MFIALTASKAVNFYNKYGLIPKDRRLFMVDLAEDAYNNVRMGQVFSARE